MTRLIDADALKEYIDCGHLRNPCEVCFSELDVVNLIDEAPTIDAEPVRHGKWADDAMGVLRCSECNAQAPWRFIGTWKSNYCPLCGARMDEE